jgi:hypothetical protein
MDSLKSEELFFFFTSVVQKMNSPLYSFSDEGVFKKKCLGGL